jgi:hypothetical protein
MKTLSLTLSQGEREPEAFSGGARGQEALSLALSQGERGQERQ